VWTARTSDVTGDVGGTAGSTSPFAGFYIWNWYGFGGPGTTSYTPRGKPAEAEIKKLLEAL
jgi:hypothetical protein